MTPDRDLLRQYAEEADEAAFAEVVRRHVDWVYSMARRLAGGDAHLAEDVAQSVFTDLARKAANIARYDAPGAWLHTATRFAAAKTVDRERRRREREQEALAMQIETATPEVSWERLRPTLDEAVGRLGEADRSAIVLRFFENKSHREIGELAGLSEDTARKRVERAIERLRAHFSRKGITVSAALLAEAINANAIEPTPPGFAQLLPGAALANATQTGIFSLFPKPILFMSTTTKASLAAIVILGAIAAYHYSRPPAANGTAEASMNAPSQPASPPSIKVETVLPKQMAASPATAGKTASASPSAGGPVAVATPVPGTVDARMQDAMAMMQPMKSLYADIYVALTQTDDPDTALQKMQELQPQIDELKTKVKGTPLEQIVTPALARLSDARNSLKKGDLAGAKKIIESLNKIGQNVQDKIENTAGISIEKAAIQQAEGTDKNPN